jgi:hypothetical protein
MKHCLQEYRKVGPGIMSRRWKAGPGHKHVRALTLWPISRRERSRSELVKPPSTSVKRSLLLVRIVSAWPVPIIAELDVCAVFSVAVASRGDALLFLPAD